MATWPEQPIGLVPVDTLVVGELDGGSCTGTLNGQPVANVPLGGRLEMRGPQSCEGAMVEGRARFTIAGEDLFGDATYRRLGTSAMVTVEGDGGGSVVAFLRGTSNSIEGLSPEPFVEFAEDCAAQTLSEAPFFVAFGFTPSTFTSAAHDPPSRRRR